MNALAETRPRISIGVPVFNGERFIGETLDSLLAQSFTDFEIIISDNGSTDSTEEICRAYAVKDFRVRYHGNEVNRGAAWNYNRVFELARGEYFKWAAADDVCAPEFLARCVAALDDDPAAVLACTNVIEIDEEGKRLGVRFIPAEAASGAPGVRFSQLIRFDHFCEQVFGVIRSDVLRQTDLIGKYTDSDRVLIAHMALFGYFILIHDALFFNRTHPNRSTRSHQGFRARTAWFDPQAENRRQFPFWREFGEFWGVIARSPLVWQDRLRCYIAMVGWMQSNKRFLLYDDLSYYPRKWIARRVPGAKALWIRLKKARTRIREARRTETAERSGSVM